VHLLTSQHKKVLPLFMKHSMFTGHPFVVRPIGFMSNQIDQKIDQAHWICIEQCWLKNYRSVHGTQLCLTTMTTQKPLGQWNLHTFNHIQGKNAIRPMAFAFNHSNTKNAVRPMGLAFNHGQPKKWPGSWD